MIHIGKKKVGVGGKQYASQNLQSEINKFSEEKMVRTKLLKKKKSKWEIKIKKEANITKRGGKISETMAQSKFKNNLMLLYQDTL